MVEEVRSVSFPTVMRGYERDAVDAYVERVNRLIAELEISSSPESAVKHAVAQVTEETRGILERAHQTAEEIAARSRAKADDRIQEAEREAAQIREAAELRVQELDADAEAIWNERLRLIEDVRDVAQQLLAVADEAASRFPSALPEDETQALPAGVGTDPDSPEPIPDGPEPTLAADELGESEASGEAGAAEPAAPPEEPAEGDEPPAPGAPG
jgi:DivIVA domain-containing protein